MTTAWVYWLAVQKRWETSCNVSSTQSFESCWTLASTTVDSPTSGDIFYIGSMSLTGSDSDCASRWSNVSTTWFLDTWLSSADLSPASMQLDVLLVRLSTSAGHAFCHAGPSALNCLSDRPVCLKNNALSLSNFRNQQTFLLLVLLAHWVHMRFYS